MSLKTILSLIVLYLASFAVGQEAVQRYYAAKDERAARNGSFYVAGVYLFFAFIPAFLGVSAFAMVEAGIIDGSVIVERGTRYVFAVFVIYVLPAWLAGIVFAVLISATMSSADADLLAAGFIFSNDIYSLIRKGTARSERSCS